MILAKLAIRNLVGGGLRTALNVVVLSFAFVAILASQGFIRGMYAQVTRAMIEAECGGGQYWHENYDPYDPLGLPDAHGPLPATLAGMIEAGKATAVLIVPGTAYPNGRVHSVLLKGIDPHQQTVTLPARFLVKTDGEIPALIGQRMAKTTGLKVGDFVTVQWRDAHGTFDAREVRIAQVMSTAVQSIDNAQVWLPLDDLQAMAGMPGEATLVTVNRETETPPAVAGWTFADLDVLLSDVRAMVESKDISGSIMYAILLGLALLAIFDTQVLSIFRRRREIGTLMALGMTRGRVIRLFTLEGALHGVIALIVGALWGGPLLAYMATTGFELYSAADSFGYAFGDRLYPTFGIGLVAATTLITLVATTVVSYFPTREIARLKPTDALRGRLA